MSKARGKGQTWTQLQEVVTPRLPVLSTVTYVPR